MDYKLIIPLDQEKFIILKKDYILIIPKSEIRHYNLDKMNIKIYLYYQIWRRKDVEMDMEAAIKEKQKMRSRNKTPKDYEQNIWKFTWQRCHH